ncbi:hypothetical protein [Paraflavitalea sp. CAU 1676]|uniref:hypothetical protein n=1 Tax=Paraflavitalea sp. CAU 1676 TaxID=3032598 RepID=UPI0023D9C6CC|nr:hypothetical protein [Paraflavitalea sp. CAU 1676]MDF2189296.1 hypothetical protein [Paraflavitalea sp. CAU 1676]
MILNQQQIQDIIVGNPNKDLVNKGKAYNKTMRRHVYGEGLEVHLSTIEGYEKEALHKLRVKYTRSNKDLFARIDRPVDKVFSARGGSIYFNLPDELNQRAAALAMDVRDGYSIRKWVEMFWRPHVVDDPYGLVFVEMMSVQNALQARTQGRSFVYPTYKSITCIYDYLPKGQKLDYVVFNVTAAEKREMGLKEDEQIYRLVDDANDYIVKRTDKDRVRILDKFTIPNFFGEVPALVNSDIVDPQFAVGFLSPYDKAVELAEHFCMKGSIKITHDIMHGFPKYYEYADDCGECSGTGWKGEDKCPTCKGTGKSAMTKVSDVKLLPYPKKTGGEEDVKVTPDVAGYITPSKDYYEIATSDLQLLEDVMNVTIWGTMSRVRSQGMAINGDGAAKTATEIMDELKPQADRLHPFSDMAERRHRMILDFTIRLNMSMPTYKGSSVNYGRRYLIEGPDVIWTKYSESREKNVSQEVLNDLLVEYYEAKYYNDEVKLNVLIKLKDVEPYIHNTNEELETWPIPPFERVRKAYYLDWRTSRTMAFILVHTVEELKSDLTTYTIKKVEEGVGLKDDTPLAVKLGVGGTQALQAWMADPNMDPEAKENAAVFVFGVKPEVAPKIVAKKQLPAPGGPQQQPDPIV